MKVHVFPDLEAISLKAAEIFTSLSVRNITLKGMFIIAVSGGSTPRRLYALLESNPFHNMVDWSRVHFFWADERCVPERDEESNFKLVFYTLLSKTALLSEAFHAMKILNEK